jgi:hypothetical protein
VSSAKLVATLKGHPLGPLSRAAKNFCSRALYFFFGTGRTN